MALRSFIRNCDGGVAPLLALAAIPLMGFVGAAVDFSRATSARTAMQAAVDATALALAKDAQKYSTTQLPQTANDLFKANFARLEVSDADAVSPRISSFAMRFCACCARSRAGRFNGALRPELGLVNRTGSGPWGTKIWGCWAMPPLSALLNYRVRLCVTEIFRSCNACAICVWVTWVCP